MSLYKIKIEDENNERTYDLQPISYSTYSNEKLKERQDLQALLLNHPDAIDEGLLILSEEFNRWQGSNRRIDLLALDKEANLVVIELKIEEEGGHMELQAIRYAAMISAMNFEFVIGAREHLLIRQGKDSSLARQQILEHLGMAEGDEPIIGNRPRIVLVAPSFSKEITTTVLWLDACGLDIRCLEAKPYNLDGVLYLDIQQVLPLRAAADYIFKIAEKGRDAQAARKNSEPTIDILLKNGVLSSGQRLQFLRDDISGFPITENADKGAEFLEDGKIRWDGDGLIYSLSRLTRILYEKYADIPKNTGFNGNSYWGREGSNLSLWQEGKTFSEAQND